jgi:hypothetical protein
MANRSRAEDAQLKFAYGFTTARRQRCDKFIIGSASACAIALTNPEQMQNQAADK